MKKTFVERSLALLLTFIIVAGMIPVFSTPAEAAGAVETHDVDKIKSLLEEDGSVIIVLDGDAKKTVDELSADYWCVLGQGNKTLDLNGHELRIDLDDARGGSGKYNRVVTMFGVFSGTTLTLNDTSGKDTGEIFLNGCMRDANEAIGGFQTYMEGNVVHRNGIMVDGGEFIMNGGTIVGGRSREEWATAALNVDKVLGELNWGKLQLEEIDVGINFKFTGDIYHQIHCDGLTIKSGNVVINAGTIEGRGFRKYAIVSESGDKMPPYDFDYDRAAGLYMTGGTLTVNNGYFKGYGGANAMSISSSAKKNVVFRAGDFYVRDLGKTYVPGPDLPMGASKWLQHRNWFMSTGYGSFGFNGLYDSDLIDVEESGHTAHLVPKQNLPFSLLNETSGETADHIAWNGKNNLYVSTTITPYWPENQVPYHMGGIDENGPVHYLFARAESSKDLGITAGVSIGGMTVSEGGGTTNVEKKLYTYDILDQASGKLRVNVKDLAPDGTKVGDSFRICVMWADILQDASNSPSKSILYKTDFIVNVRENDLAVTQNPTTQEAAVGATVTLTAKAENATAAYWECVYPVSETYDGTFDAGTGTATLDIEVFSNGRQYVCHFVNSMGEVTTKAATVFPVIPFSGTETEGTITELVFYATSGSAYIRPSNEIYGAVRRARTKMEWYYLSTEPTPSSRATRILDDKSKYEYGPAFYASDLTIKNPTSNDNGYYYVIYEYEVDGETRKVKSGYYHVTVIDPPNEITHVHIYGLEDLLVGDLAPTVSDLSTDDTRVKVTDIDWSFLANNEGYIHNSTGPLYISLSRTDPSVQITLDPSNGNSFKAVFDNNRPAYGYDTDGDTVKVSYTFDPHTAIPFPQLKIQMQSGTSYVFTEGEEVDTRLDYVLWNDYRMSACYYVTGLHLFTTDSEHTGYRLPNGLSLVQEDDSWYIRGTVTEPASEKPMQMLIYFDCESINGTKNGVGVLFYFTIKPKMQTMFLPKNLADLSHEHTYGTWVDDGNGTTHTQTCTGCGNQETVQHAFDEGVVTKAATGSESGVMTYTCEICGGIKTEVIDPHGMSNIKKVDKVPSSCIDPGCKEHYTCVDCGDLFYDADATKPITDPSDLILELAEHSEAEAVEENRVEATCAKEGSYDKVVYCSTCGKELSREAKTVDALGHDWGEWTVTKEATVYEEGEKTRVCKNDPSHIDTEVIPKKDRESTPVKPEIPYFPIIPKPVVPVMPVRPAEPETPVVPKTMPALPFTDVTSVSLYLDDIQFVYENDLMNGMSDTTFGENLPLTRGMIVTVLWRMEGRPEVTYMGVFTDVPAGEWYSDAVEWAASHGIVLGYGDGTFGPTDNVTREQLAAILFRYAKFKGYDVSVGEDTDILSYDDAFTWGDWAVPALQWACGAGVLGDVPVGMLRPTEPANRGEIAHAIHVFCEKVAK